MAVISVVVPVYNVEDYLNQCIESICKQSFHNIEIILVDDGSQDNCPVLCDEWAEKDSRIRVIHKANGGLSDARNAGIEIVTGEYITFVDSDDVIAPDMIEYLVDLLHRENADMAVCKRMLIDESGNLISSGGKSGLVKVIKKRENCMKSFLMYTDIDTVAWGKVYKTSMFKNVRYPKGRFHEDVFTTYKLVAKCNSIVIGFDQKYLYRMRQGSITQVSFNEKHLDAILGKKEQYEYIRRSFPKLAYLAEGGIIYANNQCLLRLAKSDADYKPFLNSLKAGYKLHIKSYLVGNYRALGKLFALVCRINPTIVIKGIRAINHLKKQLWLYRKSSLFRELFSAFLLHCHLG